MLSGWREGCVFESPLSWGWLCGARMLESQSQSAGRPIWKQNVFFNLYSGLTIVDPLREQWQHTQHISCQEYEQPTIARALQCAEGGSN